MQRFCSKIGQTKASVSLILKETCFFCHYRFSFYFRVGQYIVVVVVVQLLIRRKEKTAASCTVERNGPIFLILSNDSKFLRDD